MLPAIDVSDGLDWVCKEVEKEQRRLADGLFTRFWPLRQDNTVVTTSHSDTKRQDEDLEEACKYAKDTARKIFLEISYLMRVFRASQSCVRIARTLDLPPLRPDGSMEDHNEEGGESNNNNRVFFDPKRMAVYNDLVDRKSGDEAFLHVLGLLRPREYLAGQREGKREEKRDEKLEEKPLAVELVVDPILMINGEYYHQFGSFIRNLDKFEIGTKPVVILEGRVERFEAADVPDFWAQWYNENHFAPEKVDFQREEDDRALFKYALETVLESRTETEPEDVSKPKPKSKHTPQTEPEPEAVSGSKAKSKLKPKAEPKLKSKAESKSTPEPEPESTPEPNPESKPEEAPRTRARARAEEQAQAQA